MRLPVRVSDEGSGARPFQEDTYTLAISAHGALISIAGPVYRGQRFTLSNMQTKATLECVVAHVDKAPARATSPGAVSTLATAHSWGGAVSTIDWTTRHPPDTTAPRL